MYNIEVWLKCFLDILTSFEDYLWTGWLSVTSRVLDWRLICVSLIMMDALCGHACCVFCNQIVELIWHPMLMGSGLSRLLE